ncbi:MAG: hypothetical protein ABI851_06640 [Saprospiraceae bacterium]
MEKIVSKESGIHIYLTNSLQEIEDEWTLDSKIPQLISKEYLSGLEKSKPDGMSMYYGYCTKGKTKLALFHLQLIGFDAEKRLKIQAETGQSSSISDKIALAVKLFISRKVKMKGAILGNLMTAGPHGLVFSDKVDQSERAELIADLTNTLLEYSKHLEGIQLIVVKDIDPNFRLKNNACYGTLKLHEFTIQPSMKLSMRPEWSNLNLYLEDLQSKYRLKLKKAIKLSEDLVIKDADYEYLINNINEIYDLYLEVAKSAGFNLVDLKKDYLPSIKQVLPNQFKVKLIYDNNELIAFYSYFIDGTDMNAHFVGYKKSKNKQFELYTNILINYLKDAMSLGATNIEFARTALEIKSSLGAEPIDYYCYMKHKSKFFNHLVPKILDLLIPVEEWQPRSPFKFNT